MPAFTPINPAWRLRNSASGSQYWFLPDRSNDQHQEGHMVRKEHFLLPPARSIEFSGIAHPDTLSEPVINDSRQLESICTARNQRGVSMPTNMSSSESERESRLREFYDKLAAITTCEEIETLTRSSLATDHGRVSDKSLDSYHETIITSDTSTVNRELVSPQVTRRVSVKMPPPNTTIKTKCLTSKENNYYSSDCCSPPKRYDGNGPLVFVPKHAEPQAKRQTERWFTTENNVNYIHKYGTRYRSHVPIKDRCVRQRPKSSQRREQMLKAGALEASEHADLESPLQHTRSSPRQVESPTPTPEHQDSTQNSLGAIHNSGKIDVQASVRNFETDDDLTTNPARKPLTTSKVVKKHSSKQLNHNCRTYTFWKSGKFLSYMKFCNTDPIQSDMPRSNESLVPNALNTRESEAERGLEMIEESTFVRAAVLRAASHLVKGNTEKKTAVLKK